VLSRVTVDIEPFRIQVAEAVLEDLRDRLARTRWPERETVEDWSQGMPLAYARELCEYWRTGYDWRRIEAQLNAIPQFRVEIDGLNIHFLHVRSPHRGALPLVLTHGWPGSVVEFMKVISPLVDPARHGGDPADAFDVVCPSLPGYGFSDKPTQPGWGTRRIAAAWARLMARLGYSRYGAHGGDWGSAITMHLALHDPDHVAGIHLTMPFAPASDFQTLGELTDSEQAAVADYARHRRWETGYSRQQSTRPQTLGYALVDSPAAQCAWIIEKFRAWTDCDGHPENVVTRDELLDNVMLYWLPAAGASSARLYWESFGEDDLPPISVPTGCSIFPKEIFRLSRRLAERRFTDLRHWHELDRGGHFAALEQPVLLANELRAFFRRVR
jgi:pimeloyl-ACP methyl ester carboxylesterase